MRKTLVVVALLAAAPSSWTRLAACGDKFLVVGRSARFNQAYAAIYPATILLYARAGRPASPAILDPRFQASLTRAGHRVEIFKDDAEAVAALQAGRFDLVLTDVADVQELRVKAETAPSQPTVLPLMFNPTKAEADAIKARYQCDLRSTDRPNRYLSRIDAEMQARVKQRAAHKPL